MKCAFIASFYGPYYSNFVASMIAFDIKMKQEGHSVFYILPKEAEFFEWMTDFKKQNSNIYFIKYNPYSFNNLLTLRKVFKTEKVDIIYSHMCGWDLTVRFAAPLTPVIWHMHMNVNVLNPIKRIKNWIKFRIIGFGRTYHIAVSEPVTKAINSLKPHNKCVAIHNCIDFSRLETTFKDETSDVKKFLIFGWAPIVKGLDITLDACEKLVNENFKFKLLVSSQAKTYEFFENRYDNTPSWIEFIEPMSNVSELYKKADVMLSASRSEGFSFALAEAIYLGLTTVVSDIEGTAWSNEFSARFEFESENPDSLYKALKKAYFYTISIEEQERNRKILLDKYSMGVWVDKVYNELNLIFKRKK